MDLQAFWFLLKPYLAGQLRHGLTVAAGYLIARGVIAPDQQEAFVSLGLAVAAWAAPAIWSAWEVYRARELPRLKAYVKRLETDIADLKRLPSPVRPPPPLGTVPGGPSAGA